jgi:asparagine synthase (glutamine-hydrolysing)
MLRFHIHGDDIPGPWPWRHAAWHSGPSAINPLQFPILAATAAHENGGVTFTVRENRPDGDHTEVRVGPNRSITITAGTGGTAPLYVATDGNRLVASWDPADLAPYAHADALSPTVIARLLTRRHRYSSDTLFATIRRLTAGATITWNRADGLSVCYPEPVAHVARPRRLRTGADPVAHLGALLDRSVNEVCERHRDALAVELSGGLDSTNVALSVAQCTPGPVLSGGLIVAGPTGRAQIDRRRTIVEHLGFRDLAVPAADHLPLAPGGPRTPWRPHYPDGDVYQEAFDVLRAGLHAARGSVVFTGFGGDEIMGLVPDERTGKTRLPTPPAWLDRRARDALADVDTGCSPVTKVALPTLVVFAARHPTYLRAGLWPIAPFTSAELSQFGRSLPVEWRTGKELLRQRLTRVGLPRTVTHPLRPESFAATMRAALSRHASGLLADMLDHSVLIARGFVRRAAVETLYRHARDGRALPPLIYDMLALDIGIRSMITTVPTIHATREEPGCIPSTPTR